MEIFLLIAFIFIGLQAGIAIAKKSGVVIQQRAAMLGFSIAAVCYIAYKLIAN